MRHRRSSWLLLFSATGLIAGWNDVKIVPVFPDFDSLGRNVYPRNVNETHGNSRLRLFPTVYYLGFVGCSRNPTLSNRSANAAHTCRAWRCHTVHYRVISEPLKFDGRELALQPRIKRVVKVQGSEYG